jgi:hypothetical protein
MRKVRRSGKGFGTYTYRSPIEPCLGAEDLRKKSWGAGLIYEIQIEIFGRVRIVASYRATGERGSG